MTPECVVFDLGKVLVDFDYGIAARALAARARVPVEQVRHVIDQSPLLVSYESGELATKLFYNQVCEATGFCGDIDEFGRLFGDIFTPIDEMIEVHSRLRQAGIPTYVFSNTSELAVAHIRRTFPFFSNFDGYIYSFEEAAMKPAPLIYEAVERKTRRSGNTIFYIDDRLENIEAARQRRWQVVHHREPSATRERLRLAGLPV